MRRRKLSENMMWICVDQYEDYAIKGRLYSVMKKGSICFNDFDQLVLRADALFDEIEYPQSFQEKRSFKESSKKVEFTKARRGPQQTDDQVGVHQGNCFTGIIMVVTRQYANWQGCVMDPSFQVLFQFHDVIELMRNLAKVCSHDEEQTVTVLDEDMNK